MKNQNNHVNVTVNIDSVNFNFNFTGANFGGFPVPPTTVDTKPAVANKPSFSDEAKGKIRYVPSSQPTAEKKEIQDLKGQLERKNKAIKSLEAESKQFRDLNSKQQAKVKAVIELLQANKKLVDSMEEKFAGIEKEIEELFR